MSLSYTRKVPITRHEKERRRRYLGATLISCIVVAYIGGTIHVLELGANRMDDMQGRISYDIEEHDSHLRAAGEELFVQTEHEYRLAQATTYSVAEADRLLSREQWQELATMIEIPAGEFIRGTDYRRADPQDKPKRTVTLPGFKIDKYPVTNAEYARFVAHTDRRPPLHWKNGTIPEGIERHPVTMISWYDANAYAEWIGKRLPSEAEWERTARGTDGRRWPWGNRMDPMRLNTYYQIGSTTEVGSYPTGVSPDGVHGMAGNVSEWVVDDFLPYSGSDAPTDLFKAKVAQIPFSAAERSLKVAEFVSTDERYKVMRGGSWKSDPFSTSGYHRNFSWPNFASDFFGFRCAENIHG